MAALLLTRNVKLTPDDVRHALARSARAIAGNRRDVGAEVIDTFGAVNSLSWLV